MKKILFLLSVLSAEVVEQPPSIRNNRLVYDSRTGIADHASWLSWLNFLHADCADYPSNHPGHRFFEMFEPTTSCEGMQRFPPGTVDGGKYVCHPDKLSEIAAKEGRKCLIYSIGSEGNYMFEEAMVKFGCEVHTFDCFGDYSSIAPTGVHFHKWCVAGRTYKDYHGREFYTIPDMMKTLGHDRLDYLKMDVEGAEYHSVPALLDIPLEKRPLQFGLEIHPWVTYWEVRSQITMKATTELMLTLDRLGYRLVSREDNILATCCSEFVYVLQQ